MNCAGTSGWEGKIGTDEVYRRTMDINVAGTWNMATEALQRMSTQEDIESPGIVPGSVRSVGQGSIVNVGSGASLRGVSGLAAYTASKHAVLGLTRSWARDFPKMRINLVAPGEYLDAVQRISVRSLTTVQAQPIHPSLKPLLLVLLEMTQMSLSERRRLLRYQRGGWHTRRILQMPLCFSCRIGLVLLRVSACRLTVEISSSM